MSNESVRPAGLASLSKVKQMTMLWTLKITLKLFIKID